MKGLIAAVLPFTLFFSLNAQAGFLFACSHPLKSKNEIANAIRSLETTVAITGGLATCAIGSGPGAWFGGVVAVMGSDEVQPALDLRAIVENAQIDEHIRADLIAALNETVGAPVVLKISEGASCKAHLLSQIRSELTVTDQEAIVLTQVLSTEIAGVCN